MEVTRGLVALLVLAAVSLAEDKKEPTPGEIEIEDAGATIEDTAVAKREVARFQEKMKAAADDAERVALLRRLGGWNHALVYRAASKYVSHKSEAVAIAAAFNRLPAYPDDALVEFDYDFSIRSLVAIAPIDGQYKPRGNRTPLENVNYLVLHGSYDADVSSYSGSRQLERVEFTDDQAWIKAGLYIHRANHGQFNSVWGNRLFRCRVL